MATYYVATTGNDTTGDGSSGNPWATPGKAAGVATAAGDIIHWKSGDYLTTTTTQNVAGGRVSLANGVKLEGYQTTPGDLLARPVIKAHAGSMTLISFGGDASNPSAVVNCAADGNGQSSITGFGDGSQYGASIFGCVAINCATGFSGISHGMFCAADGCSTGFTVNGGTAYSRGLVAYCVAKGGGTSFNLGAGGCAVGCIADDPSGIGFNMDYQSHCHGCVAYSCGGDGFESTYPLITIANCIAVNCAGWAFNFTTGKTMVAANNAYYNNTSGNWRAAPHREVGGVTLTGDPFTNAAGHDFSLNNTSGAGAACRAAGIPGTFPVISTVAYRDIGAVQHQDSGGGGGGALLTHPGMAGGMRG